MAGQLRADDLRPVAENGTHGGALAPTASRQQAAYGGVERLRIIPAGASRPGHGLRA
jgi:hypothetical protein